MRLIGRFQDQCGIRTFSSAADGDNVFSGKGAPIGGHDGHLHCHLGALAEQPQGVGDNEHRVRTGIFIEKRALHTGERVCGGDHGGTAFLQGQTNRCRHDGFKRLLESIVVGDHHDLEAFKNIERLVGGIAFRRSYHHLLDAEFLGSFIGQFEGFVCVSASGFFKENGASFSLKSYFSLTLDFVKMDQTRQSIHYCLAP